MRTSYDPRGRPQTIEHLDRDPEVPGAVPVILWSKRTDYDQAGNPKHMERRDASGALTWQDDREYDVQHRMVGRLHPEQPEEHRTWRYGTSGFLEEIADEEGRKTSFEQDLHGRVSSIVQSGLDGSGSAVQAQVAAYTYAGDDLASVKDGKNLPTSYRYDDFGSVISVDSDDFRGGAILFEYDARGNLLRRASTYRVLEYTYDGLNRVKTLLASDTFDNKQISFEYRYDENGSAGQLTSTIEPERTSRFEYDAAGRLVRETIEENGIAVALVTEYGYDADGSLSGIVYPSGLAIALDRDGAGAVQKVRTTDGETMFADAITHWPGGPPRAFTFGSGEGFTQAVNRRYEPASIQSGLLSLDYEMSPSGDVSTIQEDSATSRFVYDFRDRLVLSPGYGSGTDVTNKYAVNGQGVATDRLTESGTFNGTVLVTGHAFDYDHQTNVSSIGRVLNNTVSAAVCLRHDALGRLAIAGVGTNRGGDQLSCTRDADVTQVNAAASHVGSRRRGSGRTSCTRRRESCSPRSR